MFLISRKTPPESRRFGRVDAVATIIFLSALTFAACAQAQDEGQAIYNGGSITLIPRHTLGALDTTDPKAIAFRPAAQSPAPTAPQALTIPYKDILTIDYTAPMTHHLGIIAAIVVPLVRRRERTHLIAFTFRDAAGTVQNVLFEVPKTEPQVLLPLLKARAPICQDHSYKCPIFVEPPPF